MGWAVETAVKVVLGVDDKLDDKYDDDKEVDVVDTDEKCVVEVNNDSVVVLSSVVKQKFQVIS